MKYHDNIANVAGLHPDYMGFIFYNKSSRYFSGVPIAIPANIKKTGVFVNESIENIVNYVSEHNLNAVQLHGKENSEYCQYLQNKIPNTEIIKAFSVDEYFDFSILHSFEYFVDYFLFDTKGALPGGNGYTFDWTLLNQYQLNTPYFLSGGIGTNDIAKLTAFFNEKASEKCCAIDVNSKFETKPGLKNTDHLNHFIKELSHELPRK